MLDNKKPTAQDFKTAFKQLYDDKKQNNVNEFICLPLGRVREKIKIGLFLIEHCELPASYRSFHQDYIILRPTIGKSLFHRLTRVVFLKALQHTIQRISKQNKKFKYL